MQVKSNDLHGGMEKRCRGGGQNKRRYIFGVENLSKLKKEKSSTSLDFLMYIGKDFLDSFAKNVGREIIK